MTHNSTIAGWTHKHVSRWVTTIALSTMVCPGMRPLSMDLQCLQQQVPGLWAALQLARANKVGHWKWHLQVGLGILCICILWTTCNIIVIENCLRGPQQAVCRQIFPRLLWWPDSAADRFILFSGSQTRKIVIRYRWHMSAECRTPFSWATKWGYMRQYLCCVSREIQPVC